MDFASLMNSQIAASKSNSGDAAKKYLKRSEVEAERQAKYLQEQEELEKARLERVEKKRKRDEEEAEQNRAREEKKRKLADESKRRAEEEQEQEERARRKRLGLPELPEKNDDEDSNEGTPLKDGEEDMGEEDMGEEELLQKVKDLGEPRKLFGETHPQRLRRYRKLTGKALAPVVMSKGPIPTTLELLSEAEMKVPWPIPSDPSAQQLLHRQLASYFDMLLSEWVLALSKRPASVRDSFTGRQAYSNYTTAKSNLTPLFRKLESNTLPPSLLTSVTEIVDLMQQRRYVHANDAYLRLSIGKAAWPIGVTMVGIHERSAREKLHESEKGGKEAHIMADEVTRKMLQGIKRCLSFAQTRWPPEDLGQVMG
jgi:pre-mRNA-splicing factor 18